MQCLPGARSPADAIGSGNRQKQLQFLGSRAARLVPWDVAMMLLPAPRRAQGLLRSEERGCC